MTDTEYEETNKDSLSYKGWLEKIDDLLFDNFHVTQDDLPDWMSHDAYNSGMHVEEAYAEILSLVSLEDLG